MKKKNKLQTGIDVNIALKVVDREFLPDATQKTECSNFEFKTFGIKLFFFSFYLIILYFKKDSPRYFWWLWTELTGIREKRLTPHKF